jgi:hypothetical protein
MNGVVNLWFLPDSENIQKAYVESAGGTYEEYIWVLERLCCPAGNVKIEKEICPVRAKQEGLPCTDNQIKIYFLFCPQVVSWYGPAVGPRFKVFYCFPNNLARFCQ